MKMTLKNFVTVALLAAVLAVLSPFSLQIGPADAGDARRIFLRRTARRKARNACRRRLSAARRGRRAGVCGIFGRRAEVCRSHGRLSRRVSAVCVFGGAYHPPSRGKAAFLDRRLCCRHGGALCLRHGVVHDRQQNAARRGAAHLCCAVSCGGRREDRGSDRRWFSAAQNAFA